MWRFPLLSVEKARQTCARLASFSGPYLRQGISAFSGSDLTARTFRFFRSRLNGSGFPLRGGDNNEQCHIITVRITPHIHYMQKYAKNQQQDVGI